MNRLGRILSLTIMLGVLTTGCGKNVNSIKYTKTGFSTLASGLKADTSSQGGSSSGLTSIPGSPNNVMTKASLGGHYQRTASQSAHYIMVGGFHTTGSQ